MQRPVFPQPLLVRNELLWLLGASGSLSFEAAVCVGEGRGMLIKQNFSEGIRMKMLR